MWQRLFRTVDSNIKEEVQKQNHMYPLEKSSNEKNYFYKISDNVSLAV